MFKSNHKAEQVLEKSIKYENRRNPVCEQIKFFDYKVTLETAKIIGAFICWLLKSCRISLKDKVEGNLDATWGRDYDTENYIIGVITVVIVLGSIIWLFF